MIVFIANLDLEYKNSRFTKVVNLTKGGASLKLPSRRVYQRPDQVFTLFDCTPMSDIYQFTAGAPVQPFMRAKRHSDSIAETPSPSRTPLGSLRNFSKVNRNKPSSSHNFFPENSPARQVMPSPSPMRAKPTTPSRSSSKQPNKKKARKSMGRRVSFAPAMIEVSEPASHPLEPSYMRLHPSNSQVREFVKDTAYSPAPASPAPSNDFAILDEQVHSQTPRTLQPGP